MHRPRCSRETFLLYAVTDRRWTGEKTLFEQVEAALKGGITCLQLREKTLDFQPFLDEALEIKKLCRRYGVPLIINDNLHVALAADAEGLHVGQDDMGVGEARRLLGEKKILGVSVQTVEQALWAEESGADYLGVGAVFSTSTKDDATCVSLETLRCIASSVSIPVCAIGGITKENLGKLAGTGIDGVALVSAIFASKDIERTCRELRRLLETGILRRSDQKGDDDDPHH